MTRALEAGRPVDAEAGSVANDSLAPRRVGELVFPIAQRFVQSVILVSDERVCIIVSGGNAAAISPR